MNSVTPQTDNQPKEQTEDISTQNKRGRTHMHNVHARKERKLILLNRKNQPVVPTDDVVIELSSFLGTLARNATLCPFDILDWRSMDTKQDLWDYTKEKYIIPEAEYNWTMVTIREASIRHRSDLKMTYYDPYDNNEVRMAKRLAHILECQFRELIKYWKSEKFKEKEKETVSPKDLFVVTRIRKLGRLYKASNENTTSKIAEMEEIEKQINTNGKYVDAFSTIMDPENPGRLRLYGVGVTKTTLRKKLGNSESTLNATTDGMQQMQERMQKMEKKWRNKRKLCDKKLL